MQPDTDLCKIVLLNQNIDNMLLLLIVVPSGIRTLHGEIDSSEFRWIAQLSSW